MKNLLAVLLCAFSTVACAQSSPNFVTGQIPTAAQWNSYFAGKLDYQGNGIYPTIVGLGPLTQPLTSSNSITAPTINSSSVVTPLVTVASGNLSLNAPAGGVIALQVNSATVGTLNSSTLSVPGIVAPYDPNLTGTSLRLSSYGGHVYISSGFTGTANIADFVPGPGLGSANLILTGGAILGHTNPSISTNSENLDITSAGGFVRFRSGGVTVLNTLTNGAQLPASMALYGAANPLMVMTSPTIGSGFGTGATVPNANGTAAFRVNVGTGGTASSGVVTMPAATAGWNCSVSNITALAANRADQRTAQTASTTTTVTIQNQTISTGAALAWSASDVVTFICMGY